MSTARLTGRDRSIHEANLLKRAWVVAAAWIGYMPHTTDEMSIPPYATLRRKALEQELRALSADFGTLLDHILGRHRTRALDDRAATFLGSFYESVINTEGPFSLCSLHEFVTRVGRIPEAESLDAPPYTELLMQGFRGLAFRHPEYMLVGDVEFLHNAFWEAENLVAANMQKRDLPKWMAWAAENVQSLARATILSCFSLLESTVSGLARAHAMSNPSLDAVTVKQLTNNHGPLLERLLLVPRVITGRSTQLEPGTAPLKKLFGEIKERRDAFMHCEPGDHESRHGFNKQKRFHEVSPDVVDETVTLTVEVVQALWRQVHSVESGPYWLRELGNRPGYRRGLRLAPADGSEQ